MKRQRLDKAQRAQKILYEAGMKVFKTCGFEHNAKGASEFIVCMESSVCNMWAYLASHGLTVYGEGGIDEIVREGTRIHAKMLRETLEEVLSEKEKATKQ